MIEIIPNWHPVLVHFSIGLLLTAAGLFLAGAWVPHAATGAGLTVAARWNLWIGTAFAVLTVAAGYRAYYTVEHDNPAHVAMLIHLKWAWTALGAYLLAAVLAWRERGRERGAGPVLATVLAAGSAALLVTGYLGSENVYRHGLGVMRLPQVEGPGHAHAHEGAEHAHDHPATANEPAAQIAALPPTAIEAAAVVDAFQYALAAGDLEAARQLLDTQVQIFESGNIERSAEEYASHHLPSDAAFLKGARVSRLTRTGDAAGQLAWIATESTIEGGAGGQAPDILSTETMVLRNTTDGWRIAHIHWSSGPSPTPDRGARKTKQDVEAEHETTRVPAPAHDHAGHDHE